MGVADSSVLSQDMAGLQLDTPEAIEKTTFKIPREILDVCRRDGTCYVSVKLLQVYPASNPTRTVIEYRPSNFEVEQFKRLFSDSEHQIIMEELDQRVVELELQAKATPWCAKLLDWLRPMFACLTANENNMSGCADHCSQLREPESHRSSYDDRGDSKVYSRVSGQPIMIQRASNWESRHRSAEESSLPRLSTAASIVSIPPDSTTKSRTGYGNAQEDIHNPWTRLRPSRSRSTPDHEPLSTMRKNTIIAAGDTVLWIGSLEAIPDIGVRARNILLRRDRSCCLVQDDISFDKLCSSREREIEAVVGSLNYVVAWRLHQGKVGCQYPIYTGPPMEQLLAARYHR